MAGGTGPRGAAAMAGTRPVAMRPSTSACHALWSNTRSESLERYAALVGRLLLAPIFTVYPQMGVEMILLAFIVVILGGMGSMGGSVVAAFVIYHLLHFTFGAVGYAPGQYRPLSVYRNVVIGFQAWPVSAFYIVAMVALGLHMYHGVWSMVQTLGLNTVRANRFYRGLATVSSLMVVLGNISVPIAVLTGFVR